MGRLAARRGGCERFFLAGRLQRRARHQSSPSHPGTNIWQQTFGPGQYSRTLYDPYADEPFYDLEFGINVGIDTNLYYYCFFPTNPPTQWGTLATQMVYWLVVCVEPSVSLPTNFFGWKTTYYTNHDAASWTTWPVLGTSSWEPIYDQNGNTRDLAFLITTQPTNNCPLTVSCVTNLVVQCGQPWSFVLPVFTNPCCGAITNISFSAYTNLGVCPPTVDAYWSASDCYSNWGFCSQHVTMLDTSPPHLFCSNQVVQCSSAWWPPTPPYAWDDCCTNVIVTLVGAPVTNGCQVALNWAATDCCGNTTNCPQVLTLEEGSPPVFLYVPANRNVGCGSVGLWLASGEQRLLRHQRHHRDLRHGNQSNLSAADGPDVEGD